jgi:hypothetical protein
MLTRYRISLVTFVIASSAAVRPWTTKRRRRQRSCSGSAASTNSQAASPRALATNHRAVLYRFTEVSRPASSGSAAVSDCISKPISHKVVGFLGFETHAQMKLIFPVNIWEARPFRATLLQALRRACHIHRKHLPSILRSFAAATSTTLRTVQFCANTILYGNSSAC